MKVAEYALKAFRHWLTRHVSLWVALSVAVSLVVGLALLTDSVAREHVASVGDSSDAAVVEVSSTNERGDARPVDGAAIEEMEQVPGVTAVYPWHQVGFSVVDVGGASQAEVSGVAFWATPRLPVMQPLDVTAGSETVEPGEVVVPREVQGRELSDLLDEEIEVELIRRTGPDGGEGELRTVRVVGLHDGSEIDDGPAAVYFHPDDLNSVLALAELGSDDSPEEAAAVVWSRAYVQTASVDMAGEVRADLTEEGFDAVTVADRLAALPAIVTVLQNISWVLLGLLGLVLAMVMASVSSTWIESRRSEFGLVRALGWTRSDLRKGLTLQVALIGVLIGLLGTLGGALLATVVHLLPLGPMFDAVRPEQLSVPWLVVLAIPVMAALLACLGALRSVQRIAHQEPADLIRDLT